MAEVTLGGNPVHTSGDLPAVGASAPAFSLVGADLSEFDASEFAGKNVILNIFPSIDTPTCATSVRQFNERAAGHGRDGRGVRVGRPPVRHGPVLRRRGHREREGRLHVPLGLRFGLRRRRSPTASSQGVLARAVVVIGPDGNVKYTELVPEIAQEPDYDAALAAL